MQLLGPPGGGDDDGGRTARDSMGEPQVRLDSASTRPGTEDNSSLGIVQFGFHAKTSHDADEALLQTRSENYRVPPPRPDNDIWKRPPPDFR